MRGDYKVITVAVRRFSRRLIICGLSVVVSLVLADRANAEYLHWPDASIDLASARSPGFFQALDRQAWHTYPNAGDYIDRTWYSFLDDGQYRYLDNGQYNLMGESAYLLGHPGYPTLFERDSYPAVGLAGRANTGWFGSGVGRGVIIEYALSCCRFKAGEYVDKVWWYYMDKGQYYYLDKGQYDLLGGFGYMFGRSYYLPQYVRDYRLENPDRFHAPEPSSIAFLGLGALAVSGFARRRHEMRYRECR